MQTGAWIALLHQIPKNQHDNLVFTTTAGIEIAVQGVQRIEADYVLVRGRQTGVASDSGGFFFIPYDRILFLGFQKIVKEAVIRSIYGEAPVMAERPTPKPEPTAAVDTPPEGTTTPELTESIAIESVALVAEPPKPSMANKAELLERLRARRQESGVTGVKA